MKNCVIIFLVFAILVLLTDPIVKFLWIGKHNYDLDKDTKNVMDNLSISEENKKTINMKLLEEDVRTLFDKDIPIHAVYTKDSPKNNFAVREVYEGVGYRIEKEDVSDGEIYSIVYPETNEVIGTIEYGGLGQQMKISAKAIIVVVQCLIVLVGIIVEIVYGVKAFILDIKNRKENSL